MSEVMVQADATTKRESPPTQEVRQVVIRSGEAEWLRGPLSKETSYRLIVSGDMGPREIGKLIKVLKAQQAVLSDDDAEDTDDTPAS